MPHLYTNAEIVAALRGLADDVEEPGAEDWDVAGIVRVIPAQILERLAAQHTRRAAAEQHARRARAYRHANGIPDAGR